MFQRILAPLDGSPQAERAIPVAARLARASGGTVVLLRAATLVSEFLFYQATDPEVVQTVINADLEEAKTYLDSITWMRSLADVHVETEVLLGRAPTTILSVAKARQIDLIVVCSHGYTGMKRWALGSVAEKVAHHAPAPVLLLREGGSALVGTPPHAEGPLRALIPLDGSAHATAAIAPAAQLIAALAAPGPGALHLMQVVVLPRGVKIGKSEREAIMHKAKQYLSMTVQHIREGLLAPPVADLKLAMTWSVVLDADSAAGIIGVAEASEDTADVGVSGSSDMIAMATHGYSGLQRWAMGSVTERVVHASRLPLLIVRPLDMRDKERQVEDRATIAAMQG